ncbi:MAG TPA: lysylphosphatidylglycerol synthase transmembrane domain-containing protein [Bacteroidales bacterium]|nr:lysylphosphatidylglycerol synthase transmembrane domain-containing protein [Bacteroidales bacterium]HRZ49410.1 lysylphosphatidylglycerol synthase transmembrane domain-containing protein [Bacteroidales bacterium]
METGSDQQKILKWFTFRRIMIPVVIGLGVSVWLIVRDIRQGLDLASFSEHVIFWIAIAILLQGIRDFAYMVRIRFLTDGQLTWRESFEVVMIWEFASSVTPSIVGGTALAFIILYREGFSAGRSTAVVMVTAMLDELFYIITVPIVLLIAGSDSFHLDSGNLPWQIGTRGIFLIGYGFLCLLTLTILAGIFISPQGFKKVLTSIFRIRFLRRWQGPAGKMGDEIIVTSRDMRSRKWDFWLKAWLITFFSWTARFMVVNALISGVNPVKDHFLLYGRQLVMWVILLISPTPGGSGTAEFFFPLFLGDFIQQGSADLVALFWRLLSYYPYLIAGSLILPFWIRRTLHRRIKGV